MAKRGRKTIEEIHPAAFLALKNIRMLKGIYGTTDAQLAEAAGMTVRTLINRKNAPWTFTIGELRDIANVWELSVNDLMSELRICV
jgi:transcriptional regulator with XRE-family HTH domain